ncbi:DUF6207 family protein [Streptomyces sp. NPDC047515]|uniref:DUF6207 family protein n=1 Tax=Streptomyces sp. NPDC047515 TaxID=3155380 RepID=UPI0033FE91A8
MTAADETTAHAAMAELERWWATSGITPVRSEPGVPGVRARVYAVRCPAPSRAARHAHAGTPAAWGDRPMGGAGCGYRARPGRAARAGRTGPR